MAILGFRGKARVSSFKSQMPDEENYKLAIAASTRYLFENNIIKTDIPNKPIIYIGDM